MVLPVNFIVYGIVKRENGVPINGARVEITSNTNPQGTATGDADASGRYMINLKSYANDGDSMNVYCEFQHESKTETFTLTLSEGTKEININLVRTQIITTKAYGEGPAVYIVCQQCGYNNYYPKPCVSYCCHACQIQMDKEGKSGC